MRKKMLFFITTIVALTFFIPNVMAASVNVKTEKEFFTAIEEGNAVNIKNDINIKLEEDITIATTVTIGVSYGSKATLTVDLNGHTIKLNGSKSQLYVQTTGKLIVNDSVGNGLITTAGSTSTNANSIYIKGECELNGGILENTFINKYVVYNQGTFTMNNGTIRNSYSSDSSGSGYGVHNQGTFTMNEGTIINTWEKGGTTVYNNNANKTNPKFIMNGGKVENKATGNPGYAAAISGHNILMTGGEIEAKGTGIEAGGSTVEITGGTINAGWYGLKTRYSIINPAEGKKVNITAGKALIMGYDPKVTEGVMEIGNKIYGGNFTAPVLIKGYTTELGTANLEVHGGTFTLNPSEDDVPVDISDYVVDGKYAEKVGELYEIKEYSQNIEITPVDPTEEVEDATAGLTENEETSDILMESLDKASETDSKIQDAVNNNHVVVVVDITSMEEEKLDDKVVEKFENVMKDIVIADYFDISVLVNDSNNKNLGTISELTKEIELVIVLPEKYINTDENVNRKYYVVREHAGEVKILDDVKLSEDGKSIIFKSDKFSTYALAYEDISKTTNPDTSDGIMSYIIIGAISLVGLSVVYTKRKELFD